jgi:hypothetical protein
MSTKLGCLFGLMAAVMSAGCGGSDSNDNGGGGSGGGGTTYTCSASVSAAVYDYTIDGQQLTVSVNGGLETTFQRLSGGNATRPIFGVWALPASEANPLGLVDVGTFEISPTSLTVTSTCSAPGRSAKVVKATSAASFTDTQMTVTKTDDESATF